MTINETHPLTESDLLELISLKQKADWEGSLSYTLENWTWRFEDPGLYAAVQDMKPSVLRMAMQIHDDAMEAWWAAHPGQPGADLINAHRDRQDALREGEAGA